jgi:hypothetical protein
MGGIPPMADDDLKKLEKNAYLSYHNDGLIDIFTGLYALLFGIIFYMEPAMYFFFLGFIVLAVPFYMWMKNKVTAPRMGYVQFKPERQARIQLFQQIILIIVFLAVIISTAIWVLATFKMIPPMVNEFLTQYYMLYYGLILSVILFIGAYLSNIKRLYVYGVIVLIIFIGLHFVDVPQKLGLGLIIAGIVILLFGIMTLILFLKNYPVPEGDVNA